MLRLNSRLSAEEEVKILRLHSPVYSPRNPAITAAAYVKKGRFLNAAKLNKPPKPPATFFGGNLRRRVKLGMTKANRRMKPNIRIVQGNLQICESFRELGIVEEGKDCPTQLLG